MALLARGNDIDAIDNSLQEAFEVLKSCFKANNLKLNVDKLQLMLFCGNRSKHRDGILTLVDNNQSIQMVDTVKYQRVHLDRFLTFETHIDKVTKKSNQCTKILWKMRSFIDENLATYLYTTLIHPLFGYYDFIYDGCSKTLENKLQMHRTMLCVQLKNVSEIIPLISCIAASR